MVKIGWKCLADSRPVPHFTIIIQEEFMREKLTMHMAVISDALSRFDQNLYILDRRVQLHINVASSKTDIGGGGHLNLATFSASSKHREGPDAVVRDIKTGKEFADYLENMVSEPSGIENLLEMGFRECRKLYADAVKRRTETLVVSL